MKPRLIIEQKITAFTNQYRVFAVDETGVKGGLIAFAQQKRIALKEKITFYKDEQKTEVLFTFRAEKTLDVHGKYFVEDTTGQAIGAFRKDFTQSLLNSTWHVLGADDTRLITVKESSAVLAILRRVGGFIPYVGDIIEIVTSLLKYHFVFMAAEGDVPIGKYQKTTLFRDHYELSVTDAVYQQTDWRVLASVGVALDALQSR